MEAKHGVFDFPVYLRVVSKNIRNARSTLQKLVRIMNYRHEGGWSKKTCVSLERGSNVFREQLESYPQNKRSNVPAQGGKQLR